MLQSKANLQRPFIWNGGIVAYKTFILNACQCEKISQSLHIVLKSNLNFNPKENFFTTKESFIYVWKWKNRKKLSNVFPIQLLYTSDYKNNLNNWFFNFVHCNLKLRLLTSSVLSRRNPLQSFSDMRHQPAAFHEINLSSRCDDAA